MNYGPRTRQTNGSGKWHDDKGVKKPLSPPARISWGEGNGRGSVSLNRNALTTGLYMHSDKGLRA